MLGIVLVAGVAAGAWWTARGVSGTGELERVLVHRGRIGLLGADELDRLAGKGTTIVDLEDASDVRAALKGATPEALAVAMDGAELKGLLVEGRHRQHVPKPDARSPDTKKPSSSDVTLARRLHTYDYVPGLRAVHVAPAAALYVRHQVPQLRPEVRDALGTVARGILRGKQPPHVASFPAKLRRIASVEVMVLLRDDGEARLWRSARAGSVARALITATSVARKRWQEREGAMGGPLARELPTLGVEVSLLVDDGTLGARNSTFLERALTPRHGIGYERKGAWRYTLPSHRASGEDESAADDFAELFRSNGLEPAAMGRPDVHLYRFVVERLGRSPPPGRSVFAEPKKAPIVPEGSPVLGTAGTGETSSEDADTSPLLGESSAGGSTDTQD